MRRKDGERWDSSGVLLFGEIYIEYSQQEDILILGPQLRSEAWITKFLGCREDIVLTVFFVKIVCSDLE